MNGPEPATRSRSRRPELQLRHERQLKGGLQPLKQTSTGVLRRPLLSIAALAVCASLCVLAAAQKPAGAARRQPASAASKTTAEMKAGEKLFQMHCGRCHDVPEDLSSREARAVVRQMRVRAMLSQKDERALLKYLAP